MAVRLRRLDVQRIPPEEIREWAAFVVSIMLVGGFFAIVGIPLAPIFAAPDPIQIKMTVAVDWIKGVSAYIAGLVGAVVGYYFRAQTST